MLVVVFGFFFVFDTSDNSNLFRPGKGFLAGADGDRDRRSGIAIIVFSGRLVARTLDGARALGMALAYRNTLRYELKRAHTRRRGRRGDEDDACRGSRRRTC